MLMLELVKAEYRKLPVKTSPGPRSPRSPSPAVMQITAVRYLSRARYNHCKIASQKPWLLAGLTS